MCVSIDVFDVNCVVIGNICNNSGTCEITVYTPIET